MTKTYTCELCGNEVTKPMRSGRTYRFCSRRCNAQRLAIKTYKMRIS